MSDLKTATVLLNKVLHTCRAKSQVPVHTWHELKDDIEKFCNGSSVDISEYRIEKVVKMFHQSENNKHLISDNSVLRQKNDQLSTENLKLKKDNIKYSQAFRGCKSIFNQLEKQTNRINSTEDTNE